MPSEAGFPVQTAYLVKCLFHSYICSFVTRLDKIKD